MKKLVLQVSLAAVLLAAVSLTSCKSTPKDSDIQAEFAQKAGGNAQLANITSTVNDGVLTLTGECPDPTCKTSAEQAAHDVKGVKSVVNNITVTPPPAPQAPVAINDDAAIRNSVSAIVQGYPGVTADVQNGAVTLKGTIKRANLQKLMMAVQGAKIKNVNNQLTVN